MACIAAVLVGNWELAFVSLATWAVSILPVAVAGYAGSLGMGAGFTFALLCLGTVREILGNGSLFGVQLFADSFQPWVVMILPPGGFLTLGVILLFFNWFQRKKDEFLADVAAVDGSGAVASDLQSHMWDHYGTARRHAGEIPGKVRGHIRAFARGIEGSLVLGWTDATRGVWKAPAGIEATLRGVTLVEELTDEENEMFEAAIRSLRERDDARLEVDTAAHGRAARHDAPGRAGSRGCARRPKSPKS